MNYEHTDQKSYPGDINHISQLINPSIISRRGVMNYEDTH